MILTNLNVTASGTAISLLCLINITIRVSFINRRMTIIQYILYFYIVSKFSCCKQSCKKSIIARLYNGMICSNGAKITFIYENLGQNFCWSVRSYIKRQYILLLIYVCYNLNIGKQSSILNILIIYIGVPYYIINQFVSFLKLYTMCFRKNCVFRF